MLYSRLQNSQLGVKKLMVVSILLLAALLCAPIVHGHHSDTLQSVEQVECKLCQHNLDTSIVGKAIVPLDIKARDFSVDSPVNSYVERVRFRLPFLRAPPYFQ